MTSSRSALILEAPVISLAVATPAFLIIGGWPWFGIFSSMLVLIYIRTSDPIIRGCQVNKVFERILIGSFAVVNISALLGYFLTDQFGIIGGDIRNATIILLIFVEGIVVNFFWNRKVVPKIQDSSS